MLEEERGTTNTLIKLMRSRQNQRAKEAKALRERIEAEREASWSGVAGQLGMAPDVSKGSVEEMRRALAANLEDYYADRAELMPVIASLRHHADSVIRDNATERFGGAYETGYRLDFGSLHRVRTGDRRVFQRREEIGGKSYAGVLVCDQSTSMDVPAARVDMLTASMKFAEHDPSQIREYNRTTKQFLVYQCALVFLEAYDGIIDTGLAGFTTFMKAVGRPSQRHMFSRPRERVRVWSRRRGRYVWITPKERKGGPTPDHRTIQPGIVSRVYKGIDQDLKHHRLLVPELRWSHGGTPMWAGVETAQAQLAGSRAQVKFALLITDGRPTPDNKRAAQAMETARRQGIEIYSMFIAGAEREELLGEQDRNAWSFLTAHSDRAALVHTREQIQVGVYRLLRAIVRRRRAVA